MEKSSRAYPKHLPEFQNHLLERKLVQEKNAPYFALWVTRFLSFAGKHGYATDSYNISTVMEFLEELRADDKIAEWQPRQADDAIKLYYLSFLKVTAIQGSERTIGGNAGDVFQEIVRMIRLRHYSLSTERTYLHWTKRFFTYALQSGKAINDLTSDDIRDFLSHLALQLKVSASTQNQAFNAILFLFRHVLGKDVENLGDTVRAKRGQKIPVVFTLDEIRLLFSEMSGTHLLIAELLYGAGLRLMELARLRVKDVDFGAKTVTVRGGKGDKDRTTVLPDAVGERLKKHLARVKTLHESDLAAGFGEVEMPDALSRKYPNAGKEWAWQYVFPSARMSVDPRSGRVGRHHVSEKAIQVALKSALKKAGIPKHASIHTLRHSFATHLLMSGVNIREVQGLLGHKHVETTMIYTHVMRGLSNAPASPLDALYGTMR